MSVTAFNRRRRELSKIKNEKEAIEKESIEELEDVREENHVEENEDILDLNKLKVDELKSIAKEKGLDGYSSMTKQELINLIESN
ncbi:hypothetical protein WS9_013530 [Paraclostridium sordellii 8483]|uniref:Rho termination factor N-terminal domain-containing protein n=1 Tax=Paraclostridium sordellii TaxID=1505 RepID=UPI0002E03DB6|nr:Rho termination factor N-terminal domain-containing protein [Paeniclostridium sordellii]TAN64675.1 hypothetical protein WS9_013530 [Paeniclostridium sordellii 8483]